MDTQLHIERGFVANEVYFGWHNGILYQLPYTRKGRYYGLRIIKKKTLKSGWEYYRVCREKVGIQKLRAMLKTVDWKTDNPAALD